MKSLLCGPVVSLAVLLGSGCSLDWDSDKRTHPDPATGTEAGVADDAGVEDDTDATVKPVADPHCVLGTSKLPCRLGE